MDECPVDKLDPEHNIYRQADSMMRVCEAPLWPNSIPTQHKYYSTQADCENLKPYMKSQGKYGISMVKSSDHDCCGHNAEEGDGCEHSMAADESMVTIKVTKAISHTFITVSTICFKSALHSVSLVVLSYR